MNNKKYVWYLPKRNRIAILDAYAHNLFKADQCWIKDLGLHIAYLGVL